MSLFSQMANQNQSTPVAPKATATKGDPLKRSVHVYCTIAYPSIVEPDEETGKYSALFIIDPEEESALKLEELIADHLEHLTGSRELMQGYHFPIRSGDERKPDGSLLFKNDAFRGKVVVRAKTNFPVACFAGARKLPCEPDEIRGGDKVVATLSAYNFNNKSRGVALSLRSVLLVQSGENRIERGGATTSIEDIDTSKYNFTVDIMPSEENS